MAVIDAERKANSIVADTENQNVVLIHTAMSIAPRSSGQASMQPLENKSMTIGPQGMRVEIEGNGIYLSAQLDGFPRADELCICGGVDVGQ